MKINWKSKNPYLNLFRETSKVLSSNLSTSQKIKNIKFILSKDYSGLWLYSHPSHKFLGDGIPDEKDSLDKNPYSNLLKVMKESILNEETVISVLEKEISWTKNTLSNRGEDWVVTG